MKESSNNESPYFIIPVCERFRIGKSIELYSKLLVAGDWREEQNGMTCFNGYLYPLWVMKKCFRIDKWLTTL